MRPRTDLPITPKPEGQPPRLFSALGLRDRLLMTLAVAERPLSVAETAALLGTGHSKVDQVLRPLVRIGIVSSRMHNASLRWFALNPAWPAHAQAVRLLRRLEERWPQPRPGKPRRRAERLALGLLRPDPGRPATLPSSDRLVAAELDDLFYSRVGTRVLLTVAAMVQTDVSDIVTTVGLGRRSIWTRRGTGALRAERPKVATARQMKQAHSHR